MKYFDIFLPLFYLYKTSTYPLLTLYQTSTKHLSYIYKMNHYFSDSASLKVRKHSQCGNVLVPVWEHFIPKVGIIAHPTFL